MYQFDGKFCFPTPADVPASGSKEGMIQIALQEPGIKEGKSERTRAFMKILFVVLFVVHSIF